MDDFEKRLRLLAAQLSGKLKDLPALLGAEALSSINTNFRSQSFFGSPWPARKAQKGNEGRALLVQSGRLRRSFKLENSGLTVTIFTDTPYAEIHNEGGTISGTANVAAYERTTSETNEVSAPGARKPKYQKEKTGSHQVKAHTRKINLAIPQRQFMGEHPDLDKKFIQLLDREFDSIFTA